MRTIRGRIEPQGPFLDVTLMATHPYIVGLKAAHRSPPPPQTCRTLVDTGASCCAIDYGIVRSLGLIQAGMVQIHTSTTGPGLEDREVYPLDLFIGSLPETVARYTVGAIGADLASEGFLFILGWDILSRCLLSCNGPKKSFKLKY